jgi:hypothetical protein
MAAEARRTPLTRPCQELGKRGDTDRCRCAQVGDPHGCTAQLHLQVSALVAAVWAISEAREALVCRGVAGRCRTTQQRRPARRRGGRHRDEGSCRRPAPKKRITREHREMPARTSSAQGRERLRFDLAHTDEFCTCLVAIPRPGPTHMNQTMSPSILQRSEPWTGSPLFPRHRSLRLPMPEALGAKEVWHRRSNRDDADRAYTTSGSCQKPRNTIRARASSAARRWR